MAMLRESFFPINSELFANPDDWVGFRDSISQADREWDQLADS
ncbi:hypothetical protein CMPG5300_2327 [Lactiplantibacillus plantarum CMPG5300]|uniref:Uncharacterized protein n=1 Tax=Lactiplantibacillus plantarum CMPG5300 TaxID=1304889 RepID=A0AAW3FL62_LACPN|nr:hypothetical protein CMPG5300_2327 [Lactiplantibacillus plantarum CMPG5300]